MTPIESFRLGPTASVDQTAPVLDGAGNQVSTVDGAVLEAQFALSGGGYLLITADEDPFEGFMHVSLLDERCDKIDALGLGLPYRSGAFQLHGTGPDDSLEFSFFGDERWRLEVAPKARVLIHRPLGPVHYASGILRAHRLILTREMGPSGLASVPRRLAD